MRTVPTSSILAAVAAVLCATAAPRPASADDAAQARIHDALARSHFEAGRYEAALREFFLEQRIAPNPRISFNIGVCLLRLRQRDDAYMAFQEYLAGGDDDVERRGVAEQQVADLEPQVARVRVESEPPGAAVFVDQREHGRYGVTDRTLALPDGEHTLYFELAGHRSAQVTVTAVRGQVVRAAATLERVVGRLEVSAPSGGQVLVLDAGGEAVARGPSPLVASLDPGDYRVEVIADGHEPWRGLAHVDADETHEVRAAPTPLPPPTGAVTVTANLAGAVVSLDGEDVGFTPLVLNDLREGLHDLRVSRAGLQPWDGTVRVGADVRSWVTVSLAEPTVETRSPATWVVGGAGASLLAGWAVVGGLAIANHNDLERARRTPGQPTAAIASDGRRLNIAADVLLVSGLVTTAVAVVMYFTTRRSEVRESTAVQSRQPR